MPATPKVLLSLLTDQEESQRMQAEAARAAAARAGIELEVVYAQSSAVTQVQQLFGALKRMDGGAPPDAIVVQAVATAAVEGAARAAAQAGVGWVLLSEPEPFFDALRRDQPSRLVACVYVDNEEVGRLQGAIVKALLPAGGSVVSLEGPAMSGAAQHRRKGLEKVLAGGQVRIARSIPADWTAAGAARLLTTWLGSVNEAAKPAAIVAQNDEMAAGAARALAAVRPAWRGLPITGCDGLPAGGQKLVREKVLAATVVIPPRAGIAVEAVARHLRKEPVAFAGAVTAQVFPPLAELGARR